ncbi:hypothetical protein AWC18_00215 [Mycolicibacter nonchromogenicus]|uniref:SGNH hydrolase-type esterase domain-containing protein n=1 Tax=Mycolicibacter nonchromogenicus TaxID=1782 RepID=A0A1X1ZL48_MYCNO|nr:SGNH/GDSL hydrolase family protein [Mycolicibacter nonchromogenicus]ORW24094.1 hypothetical protein AWC18_00215 [Mycolicibacter nonchromogenicus]
MGLGATRRSAVTLATAGGFALSSTVYLGVRNLLVGQADRARQTIPKAWDLPPRADGIYAADDTEVQPFHRGANVDLHLMVFGDSTACGYGCRSAEEVPGALVARALAERTGLRVRLSTKAIVGATSKGLAGQVDAMFVAGPPPDVAVIMIGANDVTALHSIADAVRCLRGAVKRLRASGAVVIVGTCPKFGAISAIPRPLRWVAHARACQLARAQTTAVKAAGGIGVPFADFRAREFHDHPELLFASDQYHPSAAGYALAAGQMIPALCAALDRADSPMVASSG